MVVESAENDAKIISMHFGTMVFPNSKKLERDYFSNNDVIAKIGKTVRDFQLEKIKIFSASGEIVYSSDQRDIGKLNQKDYFREIVKKGNTYSKVVKKGTKTLEGRVVSSDVVEIYIPLMQNGAFYGAFEIYHDITSKKEKLNNLLFRSMYILSALAFIGLIAVVLFLFNTSKISLERLRQEEALQEGEETYRTLFENSPVGIGVADQKGNLLLFNEAMLQAGEYSTTDIQNFGNNVAELYYDPMQREEALKRFREDGFLKDFSVKFKRKDGSHYDALLSLTAIHFKGQPSIQAIVQDVSAQKRLEAELEHLSYHDSLTGVANRRNFDQNLDLELRRLARLDKPISLIMCDIDFFKAYNDTYGHQAGDKCLKAVGDVLKGSTKRAGDLAARYGGEEFTILLPMTDTENALKIAEKIQRDIYSIKIPHKKSEVSNFVTLSYGIATLFQLTGTSPDHLVELADKALYRAKHEGRNMIIIS